MSSDLRKWNARVRRKVGTLLARIGYEPEVLCLISGAPRSGTTAMMRWLQTNEAVTMFGETRVLVAAHAMICEARRFRQLGGKTEALRRAARGFVFGFYAEQCGYAGRSVLVDKEPMEPVAFPDRQYGRFLESLWFIESNAKVILMVRDPVSTVWSMSQRKWGYSLTETEPRSFSLDEHIDNWCACADLALDSVSDPNVYLCPYGRLVNEPAEESARLARFVGVQQAAPFQPKPSADPAFSPRERARILEQTEGRVAALAALGVTPL